jgi:primary-amine oxidase
MMGPLEEVTKDLFNGSVVEGSLSAAGEAPMSYNGKWRRSWIQLRRAGPGSWLLGVDFYIYVSCATGENYLGYNTPLLG